MYIHIHVYNTIRRCPNTTMTAPVVPCDGSDVEVQGGMCVAKAMYVTSQQLDAQANMTSMKLDLLRAELKVGYCGCVYTYTCMHIFACVSLLQHV